MGKSDAYTFADTMELAAHARALAYFADGSSGADSRLGIGNDWF
jgi:hypothetical protein